jgi:hypothetical protein
MNLKDLKSSVTTLTDAELTTLLGLIRTQRKAAPGRKSTKTYTEAVREDKKNTDTFHKMLEALPPEKLKEFLSKIGGS